MDDSITYLLAMWKHMELRGIFGRAELLATLQKLILGRAKFVGMTQVFFRFSSTNFM
jgi:hypothetical protein